MKKILCLVLSLVLLFTLAACGNSSGGGLKNEYAYDSPMEAPAAGDYDYGYEESEGEIDLSADVANMSMSSRKLIYRADIVAETKDFDKARVDVDALVASYDGYVEASDVSGWSYESTRGYRRLTYTIRVPAGALEDFLAGLDEVVNVTNRSLDMDDVTASYVDTEARLNTLKAEESRLLELLDMAENLEEILQLESRLSDVRYQIESTTARLRTFDNEIAYSTVTLTLRDVTEYTSNETFGSRLGAAFSEGWSSFVDFWEGFLLLIIGVWPFLIILAVIVVVIVLCAKRASRRRKVQFPVVPAAPNAPPQAPAPKE